MTSEGELKMGGFGAVANNKDLIARELGAAEEGSFGRLGWAEYKAGFIFHTQPFLLSPSLQEETSLCICCSAVHIYL